MPSSDGERAWMLVLDRGSEAVAELEAWAARREVRAARISAIPEKGRLHPDRARLGHGLELRRDAIHEHAR